MKYSILLFFASLLFIGCSEPSINGTRVIGTVENPAGPIVKLLQYRLDGLMPVDSVELDENNQFEIVIEVNEPGFFRLSFADRKMVNLVLDENREEVVMEVDASGPRGEYKITGSPGTDWLAKMDSLYLKKQSDIQLLNNEAIEARSAGDTELFEEIKEQFFSLTAKHDANMKKIIYDAAPSLAAIYGTNYIEVEQNATFMDSVAQKYSASIPDHELANDFITKVKDLMLVAVGAEAPEISLPTPDGEELTLSSLKGKYVLIDFWAAWCRPCRVENPNVVRLYEQYRGENFEILGVSLDRKREDWLKAIEDDQLAWKHVSDLKYFQSVAALDYKVSAIPATFLIGPDGTIIAKGLRGESLKKKLEELFGA